MKGLFAMPNWRARARRKLLARLVPATIAQFPLEVGMIVWGFLAGLNVAFGAAPSNALRQLPDYLETTWAVLMVSAAGVTLSGLITRMRWPIASGMQAFGAILGSYGAAVMAASGWNRGGAIAGFLFIIGAVCLIRGWWLKEEEAARIKENQRNDESKET